MKKLTLSIFILFIALYSRGQFALGGGLSHNYLFQGFNSVGINVNGEYAIDELQSTTGNISFFFPSSVEGTTLATAKSSSTNPSQIEVADKTTLTLFHISAGYKRYFIGEIDDEFNFYGGVTVGLFLGPATYKITGEYDNSEYGVNITNYDPDIPGSRQTLGNYTIGGNLGIEKEMSRDLFLTVETGLIVPAVEFNSQTGVGPYDIGAAWRSSVGLKFVL